MVSSPPSRVEILMRPSRSPIAADAYLNSRRPSDRFSPMRKPWEKDEFFDD
jgi:hypothetical protein